MMYSHVRSLIFDCPLLVTRPRLDDIVEGLGPRLFAEARLFDDDTENSSGRRSDGLLIKLGNGLGVIPVLGLLAHRFGGINAMSEQVVSYNEIKAAHQKALKDPDISAIVFDIHSNGGSAQGVFDLVDQIYNARSQKPSMAVINETANSGAYLIASAAEKIYMPRTGMAGSIGVIAAHIDRSQQDKQRGLKYTFITAGARKADGNEHEPLSDEATAEIQASVNGLYELFVSTVARNRDMTVEAVKATQARIYHGETAVNVGLVDEIIPASTALSNIADKAKTHSGALPIGIRSESFESHWQEFMMRVMQGTGYPNKIQLKSVDTNITADKIKEDSAMSDSDNSTNTPEPSTPAQVTETWTAAEIAQMYSQLSKIGAPADFGETLVNRHPNAQAAQADIQKALDVAALCDMVGLKGEHKTNLIKSGCSVAQAREKITAAQAARDAASHIDNALPTDAFTQPGQKGTTSSGIGDATVKDSWAASRKRVFGSQSGANI